MKRKIEFTEFDDDEKVEDLLDPEIRRNPFYHNILEWIPEDEVNFARKYQKYYYPHLSKLFDNILYRLDNTEVQQQLEELRGYFNVDRMDDETPVSSETVAILNEIRDILDKEGDIQPQDKVLKEMVQRFIKHLNNELYFHHFDDTLPEERVYLLEDRFYDDARFNRRKQEKDKQAKQMFERMFSNLDQIEHLGLDEEMMKRQKQKNPKIPTDELRMMSKIGFPLETDLYVQSFLEFCNNVAKKSNIPVVCYEWIKGKGIIGKRFVSEKKRKRVLLFCSTEGHSFCVLADPNYPDKLFVYDDGGNIADMSVVEDEILGLFDPTMEIVNIYKNFPHELQSYDLKNHFASDCQMFTIYHIWWYGFGGVEPEKLSSDMTILVLPNPYTLPPVIQMSAVHKFVSRVMYNREFVREEHGLGYFK